MPQLICSVNPLEHYSKAKEENNDYYIIGLQVPLKKKKPCSGLTPLWDSISSSGSRYWLHSQAQNDWIKSTKSPISDRMMPCFWDTPSGILSHVEDGTKQRCARPYEHAQWSQEIVPLCNIVAQQLIVFPALQCTWTHFFITQFHSPASKPTSTPTSLTSPCVCLSLLRPKNPATWQVGDEEAKGESSGLSVRLWSSYMLWKQGEESPAIKRSA